MLKRRSLLGGLLGVLAAPAIVRTPGILMPIRPAKPEPIHGLGLAPLKVEGAETDFDTANLRVIAYERFETGFIDVSAFAGMTEATAKMIIRQFETANNRSLAHSMRPV